MAGLGAGIRVAATAAGVVVRAAVPSACGGAPDPQPAVAVVCCSGARRSPRRSKAGRESDEDQLVAEHSTSASPSWARVRGWRLSVYSHSLSLVMGTIFVLSWLVQSVTGSVAYSQEQLREQQDPVTWAQYLQLPDFWSRTLQNWQSEFLAVATMVVLSIYLRERGSPESTPVGAAHDSTGIEG